MRSSRRRQRDGQLDAELEREARARLVAGASDSVSERASRCSTANGRLRAKPCCFISRPLVAIAFQPAGGGKENRHAAAHVLRRIFERRAIEVEDLRAADVEARDDRASRSGTTSARAAPSISSMHSIADPTTRAAVHRIGTRSLHKITDGFLDGADESWNMGLSPSMRANHRLIAGLLLFLSACATTARPRESACPVAPAAGARAAAPPTGVRGTSSSSPSTACAGRRSSAASTSQRAHCAGTDGCEVARRRGADAEPAPPLRGRRRRHWRARLRRDGRVGSEFRVAARLRGDLHRTHLELHLELLRPHRETTVVDELRDELHLEPEQIAVISSWRTIERAAAFDERAVTVSAGRTAASPATASRVDAAASQPPRRRERAERLPGLARLSARPLHRRAGARLRGRASDRASSSSASATPTNTRIAATTRGYVAALRRPTLRRQLMDDARDARRLWRGDDRARHDRPRPRGQLHRPRRRRARVPPRLDVRRRRRGPAARLCRHRASCASPTSRRRSGSGWASPRTARPALAARSRS